MFSEVSTGSRFDLNNYGSANGFNPVAQPEQALNLGGAIGVFGKKNTAPVDNGQIYLTKEDACTTGWGNYRKEFNYSWVSGSVAEYHLTAISTFGAIGQCYILDAPDGNVKMVLDIYELFSGKPSGSGLASPPGPDNAGGYMRFVRETNEAIVFRNFDNYANLHGTGETVERITIGADTVFRLHAADDTTEEYSSDGKLLSITSAQGHVQTITYIPGTDLMLRVSNQTGESLAFSYQSYGDASQYTRIKTVTTHDDRSWDFNYDDTSHTLISIDLPDGKQRQFHYEDAENAQLLTGITDETGTRYATWAYDVRERASLSAHGVTEEKDRVEILYADNIAGGTRFVTKVRKSDLTGTINNIKSMYLTHPAAGSPVVAEITGNNPVKFGYDAMTGYLEYVEDKGIRTEYSLYDTKGNPGKIVEAVATPEQRQTSYTYDSRYQRKVTTISETSVYPGSFKVTTSQYDDFGNKTSVAVNGFRPDGTVVTRSTAFEYNGPFHQLTKIDGPRTDVSDIYTIDYYIDDVSEGNNRARMKRVTAPLDIVLYDNITYTPTGKINTYVDANNMQSTLSYYYGNDRLQSLSQLDLNAGGTRLTEWTYLATGEVKTITSGADVADKTTLIFNYDDARRLTSIVDGLGNAIEYVLDSEGNIEQENIRDAAGILRKQLTQTFDDYNRLQLRTQANEQFIETWSPNGTLDKTADGKNVITDYSFDNLRRLTQINQDMGGSTPQTADALTILNYDVQDNLTMVTDANGGQTSYVYDDLGNLLSETSPDTGTRSYTHDAAGNVISLLDAKSQSFVYSYDALNRLVNVDAPGADDDITNIYDVCDHGKGLLCRSQRNIATLSYRYNAFGDISIIEQVINTWPGYNQAVNSMDYGYDTAGRLKSISYPSGAVITYDYDAAGNIDTVSLSKDGVGTVLSQNISYRPFDDNGSQDYGNGLSVLDYKDVAYRPLISGTPMLYFDYFSSYDANGNPTNGITLDSGLYLTQNYSFDEHDRLDISSGLFGDFDYDYDKVGNRIRLLQDGAVTESSYQPQTNLMVKHANENILMDANGNTLNLHGMTLSYTADNRLKSLGVNASYRYNGLGQRVAKKIKSGVVATTRTYLYGQSGELLAEIGPKGDVFREYIYLNGKPLALLEHIPDSNENFLIADIDGDGNISIEDYILWYVDYYMTGDISKDVNGDGALDNLDASILVNCALASDSCRAASYNTAIYYIHNDHLGTPKVLTNEAGQPVWRALADPFGKATVDEDVDGDGQNVVMNFRFPGQYYDAESGLHYNYFRTYDPETGRYITSDPIGLLGGVNTYGYVGGNPLFWTDPLGLAGSRRGGGGRVGSGSGMYLLGSGWNTARQNTINNNRFEQRQYQDALRRLAEQNRTNIIDPINIADLPNSNGNIRDFMMEISDFLPLPSGVREFLEEMNRRDNAPLMCR